MIARSTMALITIALLAFGLTSRVEGQPAPAGDVTTAWHVTTPPGPCSSAGPLRG